MALIKPSTSKQICLPSEYSSILEKRPHREVLEEDDYVEKLETIVQRDFFPDIPKLKAQTEYLAAVDRNDVAKIRELQLRFSTQRRTDARENSPTRRRKNTPETFETPDRNVPPEKIPENAEIPEKGGKKSGNAQKSEISVEGVGLEGFLGKYTSEDNAAFNEIQILEEKRERIKNAWMYRAEIEHNREKIQRGPLALPGADEQLAIKASKNEQALDNWNYRARNSVLFNPEGAEFTEEERIERAKMNQKQVCAENTRFGVPPFSETDKKDSVMTKAANIQSVANRGRFNIQGHEETVRDLNQEKFGFVVTPSPAPGVNESPVMTWGEIDGTPFRLDAGDTPVPSTPGPIFKMPEIPLRDKLAQDMNEEIAKRYREKKEKAIKQIASHQVKTPKFGSVRSAERLSSMSPAARRLATSKLGIRLGTDKALKASYTPSPMRQRGSKTPVWLSNTPETEKVGGNKKKGKASLSTPKTSASIGVSLTDNLLNLNKKRPTAADFF